MDKILKISSSGREVIGSYNRDLDLTATYQDVKYEFSRLTGVPKAIIMHFSREKRLFIPNSLNVVLLITNGNGNYHATGLKNYIGADGKPDFYSLGNDLVIKVESPAEDLIKDISNRLSIEINPFHVTNTRDN